MPVRALIAVCVSPVPSSARIREAVSLMHVAYSMSHRSVYTPSNYSTLHSAAMQPFELVNALFKQQKDITSVSQLARAMHNQGFQPTLYKFLSGGTRNPDRETAKRIAKFFDLPVDAIYDATLATRLARERGITDAAPAQVAEPESTAQYKVERRGLPRQTLDRIATLRPDQIDALDRIVRAYLGAPTTAPDWREIAISVAYFLEDPLRKDIVDDFIARVDRKARELEVVPAKADQADPTSSR